jgi:hypothetical protein
VSEYIHKSYNVTVLLYHLVFPAKYRRAVFDKQVDRVLKLDRELDDDCLLRAMTGLNREAFEALALSFTEAYQQH